MKIILSSSNKDKIQEIKSIIGSDYELVLKSDIGYGDLDVEENGQTLKENAHLKAKALYDLTHENVIADDTGLFVDALNGAPGVYAARYSGKNATYDSNNEKLLNELKDVKDKESRLAYFMTTICLITKDGKEYFVEGRLDGYIAFEKRGSYKFGYNPVFEVKGLDKTLAELTDQQRVSINHRRRALDNLKKLLESVNI